MRFHYLIVVVISFALSNLTFAQVDDFRYKLSSKLADQTSFDSDSNVKIHVMLHQQLDYKAWEKDTKVQRLSLDDQKRQLIQSLISIATESQKETSTFLQNLNAREITSHWIANSISCQVKEKDIPAIARRPEVSWIGLQAKLLPTNTDMQAVPAPFSPNGRERGLTAINAPKMWALGYTGYGGIALTADTGVDPTHPAINGSHRQWLRPDDGTWYSVDGGETRDCGSHGTHVTGTILGLDRFAKDTIGVAFNAQWIGAGILCGVGTEDNIGAFEWALNPDGDVNTVDDIPHVINNSWYDPSLNGLDCNSIYVPILQALEAAGVTVIFSAGNAGPDPNTITQPHNINVSELNAFTIGALNGNSAALPIAGFSSRGPSHCEGEGPIKIKPEVSAPGVSVRSCVRNGEYAQFSGTSMAAPHTSGAVLLLREAFPQLKGLDFKEALYNSCRDLGEVGEDNVFGKGIIDVYAAYEYLIAKGHTPTIPDTKNDVRLLRIQHAVAGCDNSIYPTIWVENAGQDTVTSLEIKLDANNTTQIVVWSGIIAPSEIKEIQIEPVTTPLGNSFVRVTIEKPNGLVDNRSLDNSKFINVVVSDREPLLQKIVIDNPNLCDGGSIFLDLPKHPDFRTNTVFYDAPFGGNEVSAKNKLELKPGTTNLYAEVNYIDVLKQEPSASPVLSATNGRGIVFNTKLPIRIDSIAFYAAVKGIHRFMAFNSFGDTIYDVKKFIKEGFNYVKFQWSFPAGDNYQLVKVEGAALGTNATAAYPITDNQDVMTITGNTDGDITYPYFYNVQISIPEACGRIPYEITVTAKKATGNATFDPSRYELYHPGDSQIMLDNNSSGTKSYLWNLGDGTTYTSEDVTHTYNGTGEFVIKLTALDTSDCYVATSRTIRIFKATSTEPSLAFDDQWSIVPNPTSDVVSISRLDGSTVNATCTLIDSQGKNIVSYQINQSNHQVSLAGFSAGMYSMRLVANGKVQVVKVVKM